MKQIKLTIILNLLMSMVGGKAYAYDIAVANDDGITIYYNFLNNNKELEVTFQYNSYNTYLGYENVKTLNIPNVVSYMGETYPVLSIGEKTFYQCESLESVTIPNNVKTIGKDAFSYCSNLSSITIGNGLIVVGSNVFWACSGLQKVIISDMTAWCSIKFSNAQANPLYYAHHLYSNENTEITDLQIPDGLTSISNHAFCGCSGLTSVTFPNSLKTIGSSTFKNCSGLNTVVIPNSVTTIKTEAFSHCSSLTSISLPNSLTTIEYGTFDGCSALTSVTIPNSVTTIDFYAFWYCI